MVTFVCLSKTHQGFLILKTNKLFQKNRNEHIPPPPNKSPFIALQPQCLEVGNQHPGLGRMRETRQLQGWKGIGENRAITGTISVLLALAHF